MNLVSAPPRLSSRNCDQEGKETSSHSSQVGNRIRFGFFSSLKKEGDMDIDAGREKGWGTDPEIDEVTRSWKITKRKQWQNKYF